MKSLEKISGEIDRTVKEKYEKFLSSDVGILLTENEFSSFSASIQFGEKFREMYNILTVLEEYLKYNSTDGKSERQPLRKKLKEMLEKL